MTQAEAKTLVVQLSFERADIDSLLTSSAGKNSSGDLKFRPYVCAYFLWKSSKNTQRLLAAKGATFDDPDKTIDGLLYTQGAADMAMAEAGYVIPKGWTLEELQGSGSFEVVF